MRPGNAPRNPESRSDAAHSSALAFPVLPVNSILTENDSALASLLAGEARIAIRSSSAEPLPGGLAATPFLAEALFVSEPEDGPFAGRDAVSFEDINGHNFLLLSEIGFSGAALPQPHARLAVSRPDRRVRLPRAQAPLDDARLRDEPLRRAASLRRAAFRAAFGSGGDDRLLDRAQRLGRGRRRPGGAARAALRRQGGDSREKDCKKAARTARRMREPERPFGLSAGGRPRSSGLSGHSPFERSSRNRMYSSFVKTGVNSRQIASAAFAPSQSRSMIVMASTSGVFTNAASSSKSR